MSLFKKSSSTISKPGRKMVALSAGVVFSMASNFASAAVINFTDWYAPENWQVTGGGTAEFNEAGSSVELDAGSTGVTFGIELPSELEDPTAERMFRGVIGGDFVGRVYIGSRTQAFIRDTAEKPQAESTPFYPGTWFAIELDSGSLILTDFAAPVAAAVTSVPEPGALALLGLGLVGLGASQVRRKQ